MGRPKRDIDEDRVAELAFQGASVNEIALAIGVDDQTLHNRYSKLIAKKKAERRIWLKEQQNRVAEEGNPTMLIWLGKTELGQAEPVAATNVRKITVEYRDNADDLSPDAPQGAEEDTGGSVPV